MTPPHILTKVKFLYKLSSSPNPHEAASALKLAEGLIAKYNITEEELKSLEEKPLYSDDELLFHTLSIIGWMSQLALAVAKHFDCYVIQETITSALGQSEFNYYLYGSEQEVNLVKFVFHAFLKKINDLIDTKCLGRGEIYINSFSEGCVQGLKESIVLDGIEVPTVKIPVRQPAKEQIDTGTTKLAKYEEEKAKPMEQSVDVSKQSFIKDVMAYFRGIEEGQRLSLKDILQLEAENEKLSELL